ncbi:MAG: hypothetical protein ABI333_19720 [bacterium]
MANRIGLRLKTILITLGMVLATLGMVGRAAAQAPPPEGSDPAAAPLPPAGGQPTTTPPPAAGQPAGAPPPGGVAQAPPPQPASRSVRAKETQLKVEVGGEFFVFGDQMIGNGPAFKLTAHWVRWWGGFMLGGGPSLRYSYMYENKEPADYIHQMSLNGEFIIGGGIFQKFAVYAHMLLGFGAFTGYDADTDKKISFFLARAVAGFGFWIHVTRWLSLGALVDVGWPGTVQALLSTAFHFGKRL